MKIHTIFKTWQGTLYSSYTEIFCTTLNNNSHVLQLIRCQLLPFLPMNLRPTCNILFFLAVCCTNCLAQYPFEQYPALMWNRSGGWTEYNRLENEGKIHWTKSMRDFYDNGDSLTIQVTTIVGEKEYSLIRTFRNKKQQQIMHEKHAIAGNFGFLIDSLYTADVNGDSLTDLKLLASYGGNGTASLNVRVIYLFQQPDHSFVKVSYLDKGPPTERDFNNDGNYEIITMTLNHHENHSYWTFNLYNYKDNTFQSANTLYDYPIMIQYLYRPNYQITKKLTRAEMRMYSQKEPIDFTIECDKVTGCR
ncbi:MAG TPA: hypothetical protein VGD65_06950 [Chryseosolibacter sp.]